MFLIFFSVYELTTVTSILFNGLVLRKTPFKTTILRLKGIKINTGSSCNSLKFKQIEICLRRDLRVGFLTFTQTGRKTTWDFKATTDVFKSTPFAERLSQSRRFKVTNGADNCVFLLFIFSKPVTI